MRNGGLTPSVLGAVEDWSAFNSPVRQAVEQRGRLSLCRGVASSEAEVSRMLEGRFATLERGGDVCPLEGRCATLERVGDAGRSRGGSTGTLERVGDRPAGSRGMRMGRTLGSVA